MRASTTVALSVLLVGSLLPASLAAPPRRKPKPARPAVGPDVPSKVPAGAAVATVNGEKLPLSVYIDRLSLRFGPDMRAILIEEALIRQEAKRRKLSASAAEIAAVVEDTFRRTAADYGGEEQLASALKQTRGWSLADYREVIRGQAAVQVLREELLQSLVPAAAIKTAEIEKRYEEQKASLAVPDSLRISHILLRRSPTGEAAVDQTAEAKAEALLARLKSGGETSFEAAARSTSEDRITGQMGGKIPLDIYRGRHPYGAGFDAAVFSSPVGLVDRVVTTPFGFHVVRVDSKKEGRTPPLAEVRDILRDQMLRERREADLQRLLAKLRAEAKVETGKF